MKGSDGIEYNANILLIPRVIFLTLYLKYMYLFNISFNTLTKSVSPRPMSSSPTDLSLERRYNERKRDTQVDLFFLNWSLFYYYAPPHCNFSIKKIKISVFLYNLLTQDTCMESDKISCMVSDEIGSIPHLTIAARAPIKEVFKLSFAHPLPKFCTKVTVFST